MTSVLTGIGVGLLISLCFSFGPAFFSLLQTSVQYGFRQAVPFVFGVSTNDVLQVCLLLTVMQGMEVESFMHQPWIVMVAVVVLAGLGFFMFTRKAHDAATSDALPGMQGGDLRWYAVYAHGFVINFFNPTIWIYWLSIITLASSRLENSSGQLPLFFVGVLVTTLTLDILKCKGASMLQRFLSARIMNILNKVIGTVLMGFALYLFIDFMWL